MLFKYFGDSDKIDAHLVLGLAFAGYDADLVPGMDNIYKVEKIASALDQKDIEALKNSGLTPV